MVLDPDDPDTYSAGSFFTNPILGFGAAEAADQRIRARLGGDVRYPQFPAENGIKLSAAWLIERAGFPKGFALAGVPGAAISGKHTLALTNRGGTTADLLALARHIRDGVDDAFGVDLHAEPILVGVRL
jgi:UDP-N-acetylmuramate dehydrogenase